MSNSIEYIISANDQDQFKEWIKLDVEAISWEGRYREEFVNFWKLLFPEEISYEKQIKKLRYLKSNLKTGPLISWFNWLIRKFICYNFVFKDLSIKQISRLSHEKESNISLILRDFFIDHFPHLEELINDKFHIGSLTSTNLNLTFKDLQKELGISNYIDGKTDDDIMSGLEVTLFQDWTSVYQLVVDLEKKKEIDLKKIKDKASYRKQISFFRELTILFLIGGFVILALKYGNKKYEEYLIDKITIFEPNFFWLDKSLTFKENNLVEEKEIALNYKELENLEQLESQTIFEIKEDTKRFEVESDVSLTSVDSLPKDFTIAELEQSKYEELKKGGYRNSRYGRQKAYRVMMTTVNAKEVTKKLRDLLKNYNVEKADNVLPGTKIPGGYYFNLYVPRKLLKDFLFNVSDLDQAQILESQTRFGGPYGMNKVFIWIKSL